MSKNLIFSCKGTVHKYDPVKRCFSFLVPNIVQIDIRSFKEQVGHNLVQSACIQVYGGTTPHTLILEIKLDNFVDFTPPTEHEPSWNVLHINRSNGMEVYGFKITASRIEVENFSRWLSRLTAQRNEFMVQGQPQFGTNTTLSDAGIQQKAIRLQESKIPLPRVYSSLREASGQMLLPSEEESYDKLQFNQGTVPLSQSVAPPGRLKGSSDMSLDDPYVSMHANPTVQSNEGLYESIPALGSPGNGVSGRQPPSLPPRPPLMKEPKHLQKTVGKGKVDQMKKTPQLSKSTDMPKTTAPPKSSQDREICTNENMNTLIPPKKVKASQQMHLSENDSAKSSMFRSDASMDVLCDMLAEAIDNGSEKEAENLSKELARRKVKLTIQAIYSENEKKLLDRTLNTINITVQVEDKQSASPTLLKLDVDPNFTIGNLKYMVEQRFAFPRGVQRWVIGKRLPTDRETLKQLKVTTTGTVIFLYLLSAKDAGIQKPGMYRGSANDPNFQFVIPPRDYQTGPEAWQQGNVQQRDYRSVPVQQTENTLDPHLNFQFSHFVAQQLVPPNPDTQMRRDIPPLPPPSRQPRAPPQPAPSLNLGPPPAVSRHPFNNTQSNNAFDATISNNPYGHGEMSLPSPSALTLTQTDGAGPHPMASTPLNPRGSSVDAVKKEKQGWQCPGCTLINIPTRPGCEMCATDRPADYQIPVDFVLDERERSRLESEALLEQMAFNFEENRREIERRRADQHFQETLQAAELDLIPNTEAFECPVCFLPIEPNVGITLRECLHQCCRDCLEEHIKSSEDPEVKCPFAEGNVQCHQDITAREIKALLKEEDLLKHLQKSINTAEKRSANSYHCKTANCDGWCIYEDEVNYFECPICAKRNCLTCKAIHDNMTCKDYQDDLKLRAENDDAAKKTQDMLEELVRKGEAMKCPQCAVVLQKKDGCDWMRCSMCRTEICWATKGRRWGPKGNGDTSGGCKCTTAKRCHPKCGNCH